MSRVPSKITRRDIDKTLYLEIVSEANGNTNVQKLLNEYVRKDETLKEEQLPWEFRTNLTKRINDIDANVQAIRTDTTQQNFNDDVERRLEIVEKAKGLDDDQERPLTDTAMVVTSVMKNSEALRAQTKLVNTMKTDLEALQATHVDDRIALNEKIADTARSMDDKLAAASARMDELQLELDKKRNADDLILIGDLDKDITKNIDAVLSMKATTLDAISNMDSMVKRLDSVEKLTTDTAQHSQAAKDTVEAVRGELLGNLSRDKQELSEQEQKDYLKLNSDIQTLGSDMNSGDAALRTDIDWLKGENDTRRQTVLDLSDSISGIDSATRINAANIAGYAAHFDEQDHTLDLHKSRLDSIDDSIETMKNDMQLHPGVDRGKLLTVQDKDGLVVGKDLFVEAYVAYNDTESQSFRRQGSSPVLDIRTNIMYVLKTNAEIESEAADPGTQEAVDGSIAETDTSGNTGVGDGAKAGDVADTNNGGLIDPDAGTGDNAEQNDEPLSEDDALLAKYRQLPKYMSQPSKRNSLLYDLNTGVIVAYSDGEGYIHQFLCFAGSKAPREVDIEAGASAEFERSRASSRPGVSVYLLDQDEGSVTHGMWINPEGAATIAYNDAVVMVYNNTKSVQKFRFVEG